MQKQKVQKFISVFKKTYPEAQCALKFKNPFELLVATILSAQCTDVRVNKVTPALFKKFSHPKAFAQARLKDIESLIFSTGFYKNKAKNIKKACLKIVSEYKGRLPETMEDLVKLPGVGRKTANVIMGTAFSKATGIVVDTHVSRLSYRMGLTQKRAAVPAEKELLKLIPKKHWILWSHWLIHHGRSVCKARKPKCHVCCVEDLCLKKDIH